MNFALQQEANEKERKWRAVWLRENRERKAELKAEAKAEGREYRKKKPKKREYAKLNKTGIDPWLNGAEPAKITECVPITDGSVMPVPRPAKKDYGPNYNFSMAPFGAHFQIWPQDMSYKKFPESSEFAHMHSKRPIAAAGTAVVDGARPPQSPQLSVRSQSSPTLHSETTRLRTPKPKLLELFHNDGTRMMMWPQDLPF
jgi:hypothetical protein